MGKEEERKQETGYRFWLRVDEMRASLNLSVMDLSKITGITYGVMKNQRTGNVVPKLLDAVLIANALNTTCEYLATGTTGDSYSDYIPFLQNMEKTDPEKLRVIREMLGMDAKKKRFVSGSGVMIG